MGFVSAASGQFLNNGSRYRFISVNNYPLLQRSYTQAQLDTYFQYCAQDGIAAVRSFCFNSTVPATNAQGNFVYFDTTNQVITFPEVSAVQLDLVLARAAYWGIQIIPVLQNNYSGTKGDWCNFNNIVNGTTYNTSIGDDFHTDSNIQNYFKSWLSHIANRVNTFTGITYLNDPTIFAWELLNEGSYTGNSGAIPQTGTDTAASSYVAALTNWYSVMSTYMKTIDPNHMVGTGGLSNFYDRVNYDPQHSGTYGGNDYIGVHQLPNIDYFDFHMYPYNDYPTLGLRAYGEFAGYPHTTPTLAGFMAQVSQYVSIAKTSGKPIKIGEYGVDKRNYLTSDPFLAYPRSTHFQNFLPIIFGEDYDAIGVWHYTSLFDDNNYNILPSGPHVPPNTNGNLNDDDTIFRGVLRDFAATLINPVPTDLWVSVAEDDGLFNDPSRTLPYDYSRATYDSVNYTYDSLLASGDPSIAEPILFVSGSTTNIGFNNVVEP